MKTANRNSRVTKKSLTGKHKRKVLKRSSLPDLSKDPYVLKKAEEAREMLIKYVVPTLGK